MTFNNAWNAAYNNVKGSLLVGNNTRPIVRTVGADGQALLADSAQADGVSWSTISQVQEASLLLTSAQVKALDVTAIQLIPAQGPNTFILVYATFTRMNYGGTSPFIAIGNLDLGYGSVIPPAQFAANDVVTVADLLATANSSTWVPEAQFASVIDADIYNLGVFAINNNVPITGNAANDNTISIKCLYRVLTIP